jgi:Chaperone of endosialidase
MKGQPNGEIKKGEINMKLQNLTYILMGIVCFGLLPAAQAVSPPPDGGYPNGNTAEGTDALMSLTTGTNNTAIGRGALRLNRQGSFNTAVGAGVLDANVNGDRNTATGCQALTSNAAGSDNTANGERVLARLTQGSSNTAMGAGALGTLTNGNGNTAMGRSAGFRLTTGSNNIYIGNDGVASESSTIRIGAPVNTRTFIAGISGVGVIGMPVYVNAEGQLGLATSSQRFKDDIKPMDQASEAILGLKPVSFCYKTDIDPAGTRQFGLVAEDVEKVNPDLVMRDKEGKSFTVRYDAVNAMLLNEFLKAHRKIEKHGATIVRQQEQINALAAGLQKVSARLEVTKPATRPVLNSQ